MDRKGVSISVPLEHIDMAAMRMLVQVLLSEGEIDEAFDVWNDWCHIQGLDPFDAWKAEDAEHARRENITPDVDFLKKQFHV